MGSKLYVIGNYTTSILWQTIEVNSNGGRDSFVSKVDTSGTLNWIKKIGGSLDDLVIAQNRTTHAVRAFVRFLFIQLSGITFAVLLWNISLAFVDQQECFRSGEKCNGNAFLQFLAAVVWIVSVVWSSKAGWEELEKSNIV